MLINIVKLTIMITSFVFLMMLVIEYVNVLTHGSWQKKLGKNKFAQYVVSILLGAIPGCLGAFTVVSLYIREVVSFGALVGTMIATSGDEAYVMFSLFPLKALILTAIISVIGLLTAYLTDKFYKNQKQIISAINDRLELHKEDYCNCFDRKAILEQLNNISFERALLIALLFLMMIFLFSGFINTDGRKWIQITLLIGIIIALFIVTTVPEHFLKKHLWNHVLKKHFTRIFFWTLGTLLVLHFLESYIDINEWIKSNFYIVLFLAVLIGIIPESGPHLIFVTLFAQGLIPFSILMASSIVQDGHGTLPLLAETKKGFVILKMINVIVGLVFGLFALAVLQM